MVEETRPNTLIKKHPARLYSMEQ